MRQIYVIGHGFMDIAQTFLLSVDVVTYVGQDKLYTGTDTAEILDEGTYSTEAPRLIERHQSGSLINEHYFISDMISYKDVTGTETWKTGGGHHEKTPINDFYWLAECHRDKFLLFTQRYDECVRLSTLIDELVVFFYGNRSLEIHWTACRSHVGGDTEDKLLDSMKSDLVGPIKRIRPKYPDNKRGFSRV